jgi:tetratricopeptide (TPR) repeat protein
LSDRFGATNERVMGLKGMYQEAVAEDNVTLERILKGYETIVVEDPTNTVGLLLITIIVTEVANFKEPIAKRRIALLRSMSKPEEAISALVKMLDMSPTDAESWSELSDLYLSQGLYQQAIFSLEEVLLITPNAWNVSPT